MYPLIPGLPDEIALECLIRVSYKSFPTVGSVCKLWNSEVENPAFHRLRKACGLTRSVLVLSQAERPRLDSDGGPANKYACAMPSYRLSLHEPETGTWDALPAIPGLSHGLPLFCQIAGAAQSLVVIGGWDSESWAASDELFVYDFASAAWRRGAPMPGPRRSFFACASDSDHTVFVAGGHDDEKNALTSALAYDVAEDRWALLPDMSRERDESKGVFVRGMFHVIGGYSTETQGQFGKSSEAFDAAAWQWGPVEEGTLETAMCPRTCVAGDEGQLYRCRSGHVEVLDGATWSEVAELPDEIRVAPCVVSLRGKKKLMVIGSARQGGRHVGYILEVRGEKGCKRWTRAEVPEDYWGHVVAGCSLEI